MELFRSLVFHSGQSQRSNRAAIGLSQFSGETSFAFVPAAPGVGALLSCSLAGSCCARAATQADRRHFGRSVRIVGLRALPERLHGWAEKTFGRRRLPRRLSVARSDRDLPWPFDVAHRRSSVAHRDRREHLVRPKRGYERLLRCRVPAPGIRSPAARKSSRRRHSATGLSRPIRPRESSRSPARTGRRS